MYVDISRNCAVDGKADCPKAAGDSTWAPAKVGLGLRKGRNSSAMRVLDCNWRRRVAKTVARLKSGYLALYPEAEVLLTYRLLRCIVACRNKVKGPLGRSHTDC